MALESQHIGISINRSAEDVYDFASNPANLALWASGMGGELELVDGAWFAQSPMGRIRIEFAPGNAFGVLDHRVTTEAGEIFDNPLRVLSNGSECEVVFTLRRSPHMTDGDFLSDAATIAADLAMLKRILEGG
jgi:hypothetical protein